MVWALLISLFVVTSVQAETTPTNRIYQSINFIDDMNFSNLDLAIDRQLKAYQSMNLGGVIRFGTKDYSKSVLKDSLVLLKELTNTAQLCQTTQDSESCQDEFNLSINDLFAIYKPIGEKTKFTSYYSPDLTGSRVKTERFNRAIYRKPTEPSLQNFTRVEIDYKGALAGKGYEIFYVEDSFFDLYLLHVQGGGRIKIINADGSVEQKYLSFDGKNSQSFKMIYHYLIKQGYLKPEDASIPNQRKFLHDNPDKEQEVFGSCPSYVYFKESDEEPIGLNNIPLTEGRSVAMDSTIYKTTGLINFVLTQKATSVSEAGEVLKGSFSRFFISQDTGGAIKGNARCDLYSGYGPLAELIAYNMNDFGEQYILIKK